MSRFEDLPVNDKRFYVDPRVQRPCEESHGVRMAADLDPSSFGTIVVSEHLDGMLSVLDGQTRLYAAKVAGYKGTIHVEIRTGLTLQQEADAFLRLNANKNVPTLAKFLVRITREDNAPVQVYRILKGHGWKLASGSSDRCFKAVAVAEDIYRRDDGFLFDRIIKTITEAWGWNSEGVNRDILSALAELYSRFGEQVKRDRLAKALESVPPRMIVGQAQSRKSIVGGTTGRNGGAIIRDLYNKGLHKDAKNMLPEWE